MQVYDLQISGPTDVERINAQGSYIYYSSGSAGGSSPCVEVRGINTGFRVKLLPGQGMRLPMGRVENDWLIKPDESIAGALIGSLVIGEGEIFDNRITGDVNVIDGNKNTSITGGAFIAYMNAVPTVGNLTQQQIWNPIGSGCICIIKKVTVSTAALNQAVNFRHQTGRISTVYGYGLSKKLGSGINSKCELSVLSNTNVYVGDLCGYASYVTSQGKTIKFEEPYVIMPGNGISFSGGVSSLDLPVSIEFNEQKL